MDKLNLTVMVIYHVTGFIGTISMLIIVTLFPLVFNRIIVPEIERKIGQKLGYYMIQYRMMFRGKYFMRQTEIAFYIFAKCLIKWFGKDPNTVKIYPKAYALQKINYPYELFTRKEIMWSFAVMISYLLFITCGGLLLWIVNYYGIH
ncbi:MAG: hypothetical protein K0S11_2 [Gammaproteobacteria bacterium]|jgi:hypothetical protein|nr:hypothetical protein [Gammaproteobacteria bacterium]